MLASWKKRTHRSMIPLLIPMQHISVHIAGSWETWLTCDVSWHQGSEWHVFSCPAQRAGSQKKFCADDSQKDNVFHNFFKHSSLMFTKTTYIPFLRKIGNRRDMKKRVVNAAWSTLLLLNLKIWRCLSSEF